MVIEWLHFKSDLAFASAHLSLLPVPMPRPDPSKLLAAAADSPKQRKLFSAVNLESSESAKKRIPKCHQATQTTAETMHSSHNTITLLDSDEEEETAQRDKQERTEQGWMRKGNLLHELVSLIVERMIDEVELRIKKNNVPSQITRKKAM